MVNILYEDNHIIVCYKDYGILSQSDSSGDMDLLNILKDYIKIKYQKPGNVYLGLVHRLDRNTEGVMVFARTSKAAARLAKQIQTGDFNKEYLAIVEGKLPIKGELINYLSKDEERRIAYENKSGKKAILQYEVVAESVIDSCLVSAVKIKLLTGRFHQIRAQFSLLNRPLYGDVKYGSTNHTRVASLQAYHLCFKHPISNETLVFEKIDYENNFKILDGVKL